MLKEALAANTIGGKVDDDSRFRAAQEEVRQAQASWSRIGPVPEEARRALADRFQRAIRRISDAAAQVGAGVTAGGRAVGPAGRAGGSGRQADCELDAGLDLPTCAYSLLDLDQLDVEHQHPVRRALAFVGEASRESRSASSRLRPSAAALRSSPG